MVDLVALPQAAKYGDRVLDRGLPDVDRLESPLEGGILFDVLPVLVQGGRADRVQLAAGEHGLQHVRSVHCALGGAGADDRVQLVDEEDDLALALRDLLQHGLEALLEFAAIFRAREERAYVQREHALVLQTFGNVTADDALGQTFDDRGLADAGLADEHRVVLRAPREHLDHAADLFIAPDDRIDLALASKIGQIATVLVERLVFALRILVGNALIAANVLERVQHALVGRAKPLQRLTGVALVLGHGE